MSEVKYLDKTGLGTVWGKIKALVSPKADKSEMSVTPGTGTDADKTTIQLKQGTSATVLTQHQDVSGKADKDTDAVEGNVSVFDANGNPVDGGTALSAILSAIQLLASGPQYNPGSQSVVFPVSSSAQYNASARSVSFSTLNV